MDSTMTKNAGYQINDKDIDETLNYLRIHVDEHATREDAVAFLEEHKSMAHIAAHEIVEEEHLAIDAGKEIKKLESGD